MRETIHAMNLVILTIVLNAYIQWACTIVNECNKYCCMST